MAATFLASRAATAVRMKQAARTGASALVLLLAACVDEAAEHAHRADAFTPLFDGATLAGWTRHGGGATFRVEDGCIVGEVGPGPNTFLCTERAFADFELHLEIRCDVPGNSGVQFRSRVDEHDRVRGYQCEVDPSARAWSGGIYDEGGRGWLQSLADNADARQAFRPAEWNTFVIRAEGTRLRTSVNGVPCADYEDTASSAARSGVIGLQVHSGEQGRIRARNVRIRPLR